MADPWCQKSQKNNNNLLKITTKFEDNFQPDKLPDHAQYLALLESKLRKLKSDPNILKQLQEKREACMRQLLSNDSEENFPLEEEFLDSTILLEK